MDGKIIGTVFHYFDKIGVAAIDLKDSLFLGDTLRIVGGKSDFTEVVDSIQVDGKNLETAKAGDKVAVKVSSPVKKGFVVHKVF